MLIYKYYIVGCECSTFFCVWRCHWWAMSLALEWNGCSCSAMMTAILLKEILVSSSELPNMSVTVTQLTLIVMVWSVWCVWRFWARFGRVQKVTGGSGAVTEVIRFRRFRKVLVQSQGKVPEGSGPKSRWGSWRFRYGYGDTKASR